MAHHLNPRRWMAGWPIRRPPGAIGPIPPFPDQPFQSEVARTEQVRADLPLFERDDENAFGPASLQPRQLAAEPQDVEGIQLHLVIMVPGVQAIEIGNAVNAKQHRLPGIGDGGVPFFLQLFARSAQSYQPLYGRRRSGRTPYAVRGFKPQPASVPEAVARHCW
jgi:hypothetical protein